MPQLSSSPTLRVLRTLRSWLSNDVTLTIDFYHSLRSVKNRQLLRTTRPRPAASPWLAAKEIQRAIAGIRSIGVSEEEEKLLTVIEDTVNLFINNLYTIEEMIKENKTTQEIDEMVKVNDGPALRAIAKLDTLIHNTKRQTTTDMLSVLKSDGRIVIITMISVMFLLGLLMAYISKLFSRIVHSIQKTSRRLSQISNGYLPSNSKEYDVYSQKNDRTGYAEIIEMELGLGNLIDRLVKVTNVASSVSLGNYEDSITLLHEGDKLASAMNKMISDLKLLDHENKEERWLKSAQIELTTTIRAAKEIQEIGQRALNYIAEKINAQMAIGYLSDEANRFNQSHYFSIDPKQISQQSFGPGEGLVGQVINSKKNTNHQ